MNEKAKRWLKAAGIRALKTFGETFASFLTVGAAFHEVDWAYVLSVAGVAALYSLGCSLAGLPELKEKASTTPEIKNADKSNESEE